MPNTRMLLWVALAAILYFNYEAWMRDYPAAGQRDAAGQSAGAPGNSSTLGDSVPQAASSAAAPAPSAAPDTFAAPPASAPSAPDDSASQPLHVTTDVLDLVINLKGG